MSPNELACRFCSGIDGLDVEFPAPGGNAFSDGEGSEERQEVEGVSNGDFSIALVYRGCFNDGLFLKDLQGGTKVFHVREARKGRGGEKSFIPCLSRLTIDQMSLARRSIV